MFTQEGEQRQQLQAEYREIVAVDTVKELRAQTFKLIGPDGKQYAVPRSSVVPSAARSSPRCL